MIQGGVESSSCRFAASTKLEINEMHTRCIEECLPNSLVLIEYP